MRLSPFNPVVIAVALTAQPAFAQTPDTGRQQQLVHLVRHDCGSCHGMTLKGGLGRPLLPAGLAGVSSEGLAQIILDGVPGTPMPPWRGLLSAEEARWIAEQLKAGLAP